MFKNINKALLTPRKITPILIQTLPKAQQTWGLSSYHRITVHSSQILNMLAFQNLYEALTSKSQPNISISTINLKLKSWPNLKVWTKVKLYDLTSASKSATRSSSLTSARVTTSTSFKQASSHARVTSIKFTKRQSVSEWVSQ